MVVSWDSTSPSTGALDLHLAHRTARGTGMMMLVERRGDTLDRRRALSRIMGTLGRALDVIYVAS